MPESTSGVGSPGGPDQLSEPGGSINGTATSVLDDRPVVPAGAPAEPRSPMPKTSSTGGSRRPIVIAAVAAVVVLAAGAVVFAMSNHNGSSSTPASVSAATVPPAPTTTAYNPYVATRDQAAQQDFLAAVHPLMPGVADPDLVQDAQSFCSRVEANNGDSHTAIQQSIAANDANPSRTVSDAALAQFDNAAVSIYCAQYNITTLPFS
jgi:Protein of unknown function (DUF732)